MLEFSIGMIKLTIYMAREDEGKGERKNVLLLMVRVTDVLLQVRIKASSA